MVNGYGGEISLGSGDSWGVDIALIWGSAQRPFPLVLFSCLPVTQKNESRKMANL